MHLDIYVYTPSSGGLIYDYHFWIRIKIASRVQALQMFFCFCWWDSRPACRCFLRCDDIMGIIHIVTCLYSTHKNMRATWRLYYSCDYWSSLEYLAEICTMPLTHGTLSLYYLSYAKHILEFYSKKIANPPKKSRGQQARGAEKDRNGTAGGPSYRSVLFMSRYLRHFHQLPITILLIDIGAVFNVELCQKGCDSIRSNLVQEIFLSATSLWIPTTATLKC